jgi:hypothetical protein
MRGGEAEPLGGGVAIVSPIPDGESDDESVPQLRGKQASSRQRICSRETWRNLGAAVWGAVKLNLIPGLVLLALEAGIILAYYLWPAAAPAFKWVSKVKADYGYAYSAVATALFGGFFPFVVGLFTGEVPRNRPLIMLGTLAMLVVQWAGIGCVVDTMYRLQTMAFGNAPKWVPAKVAIDQFVYNPLLGVWLVFFPFHWRNHAFGCRACASALNGVFVFTTIASQLCATWMIWIPSCSAIYALPSDLQVPVFNLIICFSNLIMLFVVRRASGVKQEQETAAAAKRVAAMTAQEFSEPFIR